MSRRYLEHVVDKTTRFPKLKQPWVEYLEFLSSNGVFRDRETDYTVLIEALVKNNSEQKTDTDKNSLFGGRRIGKMGLCVKGKG